MLFSKYLRATDPQGCHTLLLKESEPLLFALAPALNIYHCLADAVLSVNMLGV